MTEMSDKVKIKMISDSKRIMAYFPSSGIPFDAEFGFKTEQNSDKNKLNALDLNSNLKFIGDESINKNSNYYLGEREGNVLKVYPAVIYRMDPIIETNDQSISGNPFQTPLTIREQLDELKEKFGSRKTQRSLASKRKYAIEFGEDDLNDIESNSSQSSASVWDSSSGETPKTGAQNVDILPNQNRDAISVNNVYQLEDIIPESEKSVIKQMERDMYKEVKNPFILSLISNPNDINCRIIAIYIDLIIQLVSMKATDLKKADPLPHISNEVKIFLFERYTYTQDVARNKYRYIISDKEKDRLLIYVIILSLMLNNYRPIDMEDMQKAIKVPLKQLRRLVEIIGCYIENSRNSSGVNTKCFVLKIPLNILKESKRRR